MSLVKELKRIAARKADDANEAGDLGIWPEDFIEFRAAKRIEELEIFPADSGLFSRLLAAWRNTHQK